MSYPPLDSLYEDHADYVKQVKKAAKALKKQGLLLRRNAKQIKQAAKASDIGN
jgi:hypothetical protein